VGGTITAVTKTEVTVDVPGSGAQSIPANDIAEIEWEGESGVFKRARSEEASGQYEAALASFQQALDENPESDNIQVDIQFYMARTTARMALADPNRIEAAKSLLLAFVDTQRDHYRFYEAQFWLGDIALEEEDLSAADEAFNSLANSPWLDFQMSGKIGMARVLLARDDLRGARQGFDEVVNTPVTDDASRKRRLEAMVGQARIMQLEEQYESAVTTLTQIIDEAEADDTRVQAEAYLLLGRCYQSMDVDPKEAIMAYLHIDVIPALAQETDLHAEALTQLSRLRTQIGDEDRAADAEIRLGQLQGEAGNSP
jgi:tetratricopeptide (TPR) repeat protein